MKNEPKKMTGSWISYFKTTLGQIIA